MASTRRTRVLSHMAGAVAVLLSAPTWPATDQHVGVASCAGSACHGATSAFAGATVLQNEYFTWQRNDRHARAFATLSGAAARRMASNLGLSSASSAGECLVCHADAPAAPLRAKGHRLSDGVGCEACHGGAERWLPTHTAGFKTDAQRRQAGLAPIWDADSRARACLSCHQGDAQRPMTHRILGAGHPPLRFELDTYMSVMPPHHAVDADYVQRKGAQDGASNWIIGQKAAADQYLARLAAGQGVSGLFPELALFDCNACHHSLKIPRWERGLGSGMPGTVRLADTSLQMVAYWLDGADAALAKRWREGMGNLQNAAQESPAALRQQAVLQREMLVSAGLSRLFTSAPETPALRALLLRILREHRRGAEGSDFSNAEQATMSVAVLFTALTERSGARKTPAFEAALTALYDSVENADRFNPSVFRQALGRVEAELSKAR